MWLRVKDAGRKSINTELETELVTDLQLLCVHFITGKSNYGFSLKCSANK